MAIKAQALANFVAEFTHDAALEPKVVLSEVKALEEQNSDEDLTRWKLFIGESSN